MINLKHLTEITGGDQTLLREIVGLFLDDCPEQLRSLRAALEQGDLSVAERCAHNLKGAVSNFETGGVYDISQRVEEASREGQLMVARQLLKALEYEVQALLPELEAHLT